MIITGFRVEGLNLVSSADVTYSKSYLGLLSMLGAFLSIIICCIPISQRGFIHLLGYMQRQKVDLKVQESSERAEAQRTVPLVYHANMLSREHIVDLPPTNQARETSAMYHAGTKYGCPAMNQLQETIATD